MKIYDGKKTVELKMCVWEGSGYSPDWSEDFFEAGSLDYDEEREAYRVESVDYCIEQAEDWAHSTGDFSMDAPNENNTVIINELK